MTTCRPLVPHGVAAGVRSACRTFLGLFFACLLVVSLLTGCGDASVDSGSSAQREPSHAAIVAEHKAGYHGRAMIDPLFRKLSVDVSEAECVRGPALVNLRDSGFETPIARGERRDDPISGVGCRRSGNKR